MHDLDATCLACGKPIEDGEGAIWCPGDESARAQQAVREWEEQHPGPVTASDLDSLPGHATWRTIHFACGPADLGPYDIDIAEVRTWRGLVHWTSHLMEKDWIGSTDWDRLLRDADLGTDERLHPRTPPPPR